MAMTPQNRNLLLRIATAFTLLPVVIWLLALGGVWFALLLSVAACLSALEVNLMAANAPSESGAPAPASSPGILASAAAAFLIPLATERLPGGPPLDLIWIALTMIALVDALFLEHDLKRAPTRVGIALFAPAYAGVTLATLVQLRAFDRGAFWIVLTLVVTWFNDTGGYFAGRFLGKHKLYPRISPSKTVEGALGGMVASSVGACAVKLLWIPALPLWGAALIGLLGSIAGPLGDLSESMLKRGFGAKDSGKMLPGHGGMLDRIDALLFVGPMVLFVAREILGLR